MTDWNNPEKNYQNMQNQGYPQNNMDYPPQVSYQSPQGGYPPTGGYPPHSMQYPGSRIDGQHGMPPSNPGSMNPPPGGDYSYRSFTQTYSAAPVPAGSQPAGRRDDGKNYNFLDPIIPTEKRESYAKNLLQAQNQKITEVYKKLYIGKIPTGIKDTLIERLLKACGTVEYWKRAINASNQPKSFGY